MAEVVVLSRGESISQQWACITMLVNKVARGIGSTVLFSGTDDLFHENHTRLLSNGYHVKPVDSLVYRFTYMGTGAV